MQLKLIGLASSKEYQFDVSDSKQSLMDLLINNGYPVASSCNGEGICKKCFILDKQDVELISCQISTESFYKNHGEEIKVTYL